MYNAMHYSTIYMLGVATKRILKLSRFSRWLKKAGLSDADLCKAVEEMAHGLIDADLGGNIYKKRIALPGRGKRGSTRTLLASNLGARWFFMFGLEKNDRENFTPAEMAAVRKLAKEYLAMTDDALESAVAQGIFVEVHDEQA